MNKLKAFLEQLRNLDPNDPGRWPLCGPPRRDGAPRVRAWPLGAATTGSSGSSQRPLLLDARAKEGRALDDARDQSEARRRICRRTRTSSRRWRSRSAPCCGSCRTRPRCRTCWSTSRRRPRRRPRGKAVPAGGRGPQGLLRRAADHDPAHRRLPRDGPVRERHRRVAAHRHAARHRDHAASAAATAPAATCRAISCST